MKFPFSTFTFMDQLASKDLALTNLEKWNRESL